MTRPLQKNMLIIRRYGLAALSVVLAVLPALLLQYYKFHDVELPLLSVRHRFHRLASGTGAGSAGHCALEPLLRLLFRAAPLRLCSDSRGYPCGSGSDLVSRCWLRASLPYAGALRGN